jgi:hypothetical protein
VFVPFFGGMCFALGTITANRFNIGEMSRVSKTLKQAGKGDVMDEMYEMGGLFNTKANVGGSAEISPIERLLNEFEAHEAKEEKSIEQYKTLMRGLPNPVTNFILQLIISDEEKHRAVIHAMTATLKGCITWTKPEGSLEGATNLSVLNGRLRVSTEEFIELEKEGIKECKKLMKESTGYYHGLFKILLHSMMRDSEKHIELLEFLKDSLK